MMKWLIVAVAVLALGAADQGATVTLNNPPAIAGTAITFSYSLPKRSAGDCAELGSKTFAAIQLWCYDHTGTLVWANLLPALGNAFTPNGGTHCTATLEDYANPYPSPVRQKVWATTVFEMQP